MGRCLDHRGPDEEGAFSYADERVDVHFAHRRLSIIDLQHGQQPLVKHPFVLCYNGELYNFREIRAELAAGGARFSTTSDTEVVLEAWRRWGPGCLKRFRGMFAFAVLDQSTGSLFLARDQFGIKPLHFIRRKDGVVFASELKALVSTFGSELHMLPEALVASMLYYWVPDQMCSVKGVEKLQPGTWAEFRPDGTHRVERYWDVVEEASAAQEAALRPPGGRRRLGTRPPRRRRPGLELPLRWTRLEHRDRAGQAGQSSDRRLHHHLPGRRTIGSKPCRMTLSTPGRSRSVTGSTCTRSRSSPTWSGLLPRMVDILDEPIGDPAAINTLLMSEAARDAGVKVLLSGMGADELFGGYRKHVACMLAGRYRELPGFVHRSTNGVVERLPVDRGGARPSLRPMGQAIRDVRRAARGGGVSEELQPVRARRAGGVPEPRFAARRRHVIVEQHLQVYEDNHLSDRVNRMCLADTRMFLPGLNLTYTDRASMAASTEVRVPFVDPVVFRAAFSLSGKDKVSGQNGKGRPEARRRGVAPEGDRRTAPRRRSRLRSGRGCPRTCARSSTTRCSAASSSARGSSTARPFPLWSKSTGRAERTDPSRSGSCSRSRRGIARLVKRASGCDPNARKGIRGPVKQMPGCWW